MNTPTAADIRQWSKIPFGQLGFPDGTPDPLQRIVDVALGFFFEITGRRLDTTWPGNLDEHVAEYTVQRIAEILAYQAQKSYVSTLQDFQVLSGFSAGSYSETRRSLTEIKQARMVVGDPALDSMLWPLMTDEKYDFWLEWAGGNPRPAWGVTEVDWSAGYIAPSGLPYDHGPPYESAVDWDR
jgi:hypothetical protein